MGRKLFVSLRFVISLDFVEVLLMGLKDRMPKRKSE
jgi:hypothetical protein